MFTKIVVHFHPNDCGLRATLERSTNSPPSGVLFFANEAERNAFANAHHLEVKEKSALPASVKLNDSSEKTLELNDIEGPGVCYLEGSVLVCW
jgi:hypothetical protein